MWQLIYENSPWPDKPKLSRNLVSAVHSFLTVALLTTKHFIKYEIIVINSVSYFIWDLIYMFKTRIEPMFVYHHLVAISLLLSNLDKYLIRDVFFYGELSNVFNYIVYHFLQTDVECWKLRIVQSLWFSYFRMYKFTLILLDNIQYNIIAYNGFVLYLMGMYWSCMQVKKLIVFNK